MASGHRITLFRNGQKGHGYLVFLPDTLEDLLRIACDKLDMHATRVFSDRGAVIDDIRLIRDNDVVFVGGEAENFSEHAERPLAEESGGIKRKSEHLEPSSPLSPSAPLLPSPTPPSPSSSSQDPEQQQQVKLFVGSLHRNVSKDDVEKMFAQHGTVVEIKLLTDKITGASKGAAFVRYASRAAGERAIAALHNTTMPGTQRPITVKYAEGDPAAAEIPGEYKLFVGSLPKTVTEAQLQEIFAPFGKPSEIVVLRSTPTQSRSGAFVKFRFKREAQAAINAAHTLSLEGTPLVVRFADPSKLSSVSTTLPFARLSQMSITTPSPSSAVPQPLTPSHRPVVAHGPMCPALAGYTVCTCGASAAQVSATLTAPGPMSAAPATWGAAPGASWTQSPSWAASANSSDVWKRQMVQPPTSPQRAAYVLHPAVRQAPPSPLRHEYFGGEIALNPYQSFQH